MPVPPALAPNRLLFTMLRVRDLDLSVAFYRETYPEAKFTAVFMGYGDRRTDTLIELTHNWENDGYDHGTAFGNISLGVDDVYAFETFLNAHDVTILRPAGELPIVSTETGQKYTFAHIADPDGYRIELMQN
jgi:lactoylglutathione lyase